MGVLVIYGNAAYIVGRQNWPGVPALLVDSVTVEGLGKMLNSSWAYGPRYKWAKVTVDYKIPEHEDDKNDDGQPATYLIESLDYNVEIAVIPVQVVDDVDKKKIEEDAAAFKERIKNLPSSNEDGSPFPIPPNPANIEPKKKTVKRHIRIPTVTYTVTIPRAGFLPNEQIQAAVGKVNSKQIFGAAPGTVLFDGPNAERESQFLTARTWKIKYNFIYQPFGWNNILHPDTLKWVPCIAAGSDNPPYESYNLANVVPPPYSVRS